MEPEFSSMIKDVQRRERLARIERWAGMAMQARIVYSGTIYKADEFFNKAEEMEAEYQKRYNTNQDN
jgi:hypothetical protein